jgi:ribonuclease BN (tRNA processing enzyme)
MKIKILGTRGEIEESAPYHSKKSGILLDNKVLLDVGDSRFLEYKPHYILITHLHPDHAYFVRDAIHLHTTAHMYAPQTYEGINIHVSNKPFKIDDYAVTPIPTVHSIKVKSNAYLIEHNDKRILYTGDMIWIEKKYHHFFKNLDLVITEGSYIRTGGLVRRKKDTTAIYGHTGIPNLINLFKKYTHTLVLVHFGAWFYKDIKNARKILTQLAKEHDIEIIVGYDGLELEL